MASEVVIFKPKKVNKKALRKPITEVDDGEVHTETIESLKEFQSLRKKPRGLSLETYSLEEDKAKNIETGEFASVKIGGLFEVASQFLKKDEPEDDFELNIGTAFSKETNKKEDFTEMMKFIEEELGKRKQIDDVAREERVNKTTVKLHPNDAFYYLSEHLKKTYVENKKNKSEEMLSNQMLSGIPEVNLGLETKIANIEATELEKQKVIENKNHQFHRRNTCSFVPTNIAVNYVQHDRYNMESEKTFYISKDLSVSNYDKPSPPHSSSDGANKSGTSQTLKKTEPTVKIDDSDLDPYPISSIMAKEEPIYHKRSSNETLISKLEALEQKKHKNEDKAKSKSDDHSKITKKSTDKKSSENFSSNNYYNPEKATDDFHFEKFRKKFSRR